MILPSSSALEGPRQLTEYRPTGLVAGPDDAAAAEGAGRDRRPPGHRPRARRPCRGQRRGDARAGERGRAGIGGGRGRPAPCPSPTPTSRRPISTRSRSKRRQACQSAIGKGFDPVLLDGVTGSGKTEVYFEAIAECLRQGKQALVLLPEIALTEPFLKRFQTRFGCEPVAWHSDLRSSQRRRAWRGDRQRRGQGHRRRTLGPVPALREPRPDRRRRGARAELQAGGRRPVPRPRRRGDAREVRGHSGHPLLRDARDRDPAHGRDRPLSRGDAKPSLRRREHARNPGHRSDAGPAARADAGWRRALSPNWKPISNAASSRCCSSTGEASLR